MEEAWETFLERLIARLHTLQALHAKVDVQVFLGRMDRISGVRLPPRFTIRWHGEDRWEEG